jgi:hypothetical protein
MNPERVRRLRITLATLALVAATWGFALVATGGIALEVLGIPITSRNPRNPLLVSALAALGAWALPVRDRRRVLVDAGRRLAAFVIWPRSEVVGLRWAEPAMLIVVLFAAMDVYLWAGGRPLWVDEEMIAVNLRDRGFVELAGPLWLDQSAPYGWLVTQRALLVGLGTDERVLHLVPLLHGSALLVLAVVVGRRILSPWSAALFVLLCAVGQWTAHFRFELKPYSADAFWGLLLPMLAIRITSVERDAVRLKRALGWWAIAGAGLWMANGALLAGPACAAALLISEWQRTGWGGAARLSRGAAVWLASFGLHYLVSLRHAISSAYLREYWSAGFPPASAGAGEILLWLVRQLERLALNPGGTDHWVGLWVSAFCGFVLAGRHRGPVLAALPLSAFVLGALALVPLVDRLALWVVPVSYLGAVLFVEETVRRAANAGRSWRPAWVMAVLAATALVVPVSLDVFSRGWIDYRFGRWPTGNNGVDDRAAVRWLMGQRRVGDVLITTQMGAPAVWWYGNAPVSDPAGGRALPDGTPILEAALEAAGTCPPDPLDTLLAGPRRVLIYSGFQDQPAGFSALLVQRLSRRGTVVAERHFDLNGHAAVVDLGAAEEPAGAVSDTGVARPIALRGCVVGRPARRW